MLPQCLLNVSLPLLLTTSQSPNIDPSPSRVTFVPLSSSLTCFWVDCAISSYHWFPSPEVQFPLGPFLTFRTALVLPLLRILRWPPLTLRGKSKAPHLCSSAKVTGLILCHPHCCFLQSSLFILLAMLQGLQDLSSPTRD